MAGPVFKCTARVFPFPSVAELIGKNELGAIGVGCHGF